MHIVEKLEEKIDSLLIEIKNLENEKIQLQQEIEKLNDINDQLKYNNETMLLNIDKALHITSETKEKTDDILH
jgi:prefoldin subunit 5